MPTVLKRVNKVEFHYIRATIRTRQESRCLQYNGILLQQPTRRIQSWSRDSVCVSVCDNLKHPLSGVVETSGGREYCLYGSNQAGG